MEVVVVERASHVHVVAAADSLATEGTENFDRNWKHDRRVLLGGNLRQSLEEAQLERRRRLADDVRCLLESLSLIHI